MKDQHIAKQSRLENIVYLTVWGMLFFAPLLVSYERMVHNPEVPFDWAEVFVIWRILSFYLVLFVIHNFLLAPLLFHKRKRFLYFFISTIILLLMIICVHKIKPERIGNDEHIMLSDVTVLNRQQEVAAGDCMLPPPPPPTMPPPDKYRIVEQRNLMSIIILVFMFGANFGIKGYFRGRNIRARLSELEKQNLEHQLEYLRCQINPHFFMNTLNNIHSLVDVAPEQAQKAIRELAKMMRFVLYEENKQDVPLSHELEFIRHYITLMQLRYTDAVRVDAEIPENVPNYRIPPMILITFIENAFKHGISYRHNSFVCVKIIIFERILQFICSNSKVDTSNEEKTGIGLVNVRKRLDLLYGSKYNLFVTDNADIYSVKLVVPLK